MYVCITNAILPSLPKSVRVRSKRSEVAFFNYTTMGNTEENRSKILLTRLKPGELSELDKKFQKTRFRKLSEYVRCVLLEKPVTVIYRDKAMDDILEELILLRRELNAVGNNLNQAMRSINAAHGQAEQRLWAGLFGIIQSKIEPAVRQIKDRMNEYAEIWSRKSKAEKI